LPAAEGAGPRTAPASAQTTAIRQKVELRFEKGEAARFISHLDLVRAFQRALRRAQLPVRLTAGFNPRPRIVFPTALEAGTASLAEVAELELSQWIPLNEIHQRLTRSLPPGLVLNSVRELPPRRQARQPTRLRYRVRLEGMRLTEDSLAQLLAAPALPFRRAIRPGRESKPRSVDLRPSLLHTALDAAGDLLLDLRPQPQCTARPLELLSLLTGKPLEQLRHIRVIKLEMDLAAYPAEAERPL
jgi:radical SAM-linked protein